MNPASFDKSGAKPSSRVFLAGFMGAGKTSVGPLLAEALGWEFVDLDHAIEKGEGTEISRIFREQGERGFREIESRELGRLARRENLVIALGGGTLLRDENWKQVSESGMLIYLRASLETLAGRIRGDSRERPLARALGADLSELFAARKTRYELASIHVDTDGKSPAQIASEIAAQTYRSEPQ